MIVRAFTMLLGLSLLFSFSYLRFCVAQGGGGSLDLGVSDRSCLGNGDVTGRRLAG